MPENHSLRRRAAPYRRITTGLVVASHRTGDAIELPNTAALIWEFLADWTDIDSIRGELARRFPGVARGEVSNAVDQVVELLSHEGLLDTRVAEQ